MQWNLDRNTPPARSASFKKILSDISTSLLARVIIVIVVDKVDILEMQAYGIPLTKKVVEAKKT